jgi:hypothetical protein
MGGGWSVSSPSSRPAVKPSGPGSSLPVRGVRKRLSMPGEGKMLSTARAGASLRGGGAFLAVADGGERLVLTAGGGTSSVANGGGTFLVAGGRERLAVAVGAGTSSVTDGGEARMTDGGFDGTSGSDEPSTVGRVDETPAPAGLLHHRLRPLERHAVAGGEPWSVTDGGGASESGAAEL